MIFNPSQSVKFFDSLSVSSFELLTLVTTSLENYTIVLLLLVRFNPPVIFIGRNLIRQNILWDEHNVCDSVNCVF